MKRLDDDELDELVDELVMRLIGRLLLLHGLGKPEREVHPPVPANGREGLADRV